MLSQFAGYLLHNAVPVSYTHLIEDITEIRGFDRLNYRFHPEFSSETEYVFLKNPMPPGR